MKNNISIKLKINRPRWFSILNRMTMAILFLGFVNMAVANNYAQRTKLSLSFNNTTLKKVFKEIEKQSEFYFMYNNTHINVKKKISLHVENQTIYQILDKVLKDAGIDYEVFNKQIVLMPKIAERQPDHSIKTIEITGTISDESGATLPGVSVMNFSSSLR